MDRSEQRFFNAKCLLKHLHHGRGAVGRTTGIVDDIELAVVSRTGRANIANAQTITLGVIINTVQIHRAFAIAIYHREGAVRSAHTAVRGKGIKYGDCTINLSDKEAV